MAAGEAEGSLSPHRRALKPSRTAEHVLSTHAHQIPRHVDLLRLPSCLPTAARLIIPAERRPPEPAALQPRYLLDKDPADGEIDPCKDSKIQLLLRE